MPKRNYGIPPHAAEPVLRPSVVALLVPLALVSATIAILCLLVS